MYLFGSYSEESLEYILHKITRLPPADYLANVQQDMMNERQRRAAIHWIHEAGEALGAQLKTVHLAVTYFDVFLSLKQIRDTRLLELISVLSLSQALKYEEARELSLRDLHSMLHERYPVDAIRATEIFLLKELNWDLDWPTADELLVCFFEVTCTNFDYFPLLSRTGKYLKQCYLEYSVALRGPHYSAVCTALCVLTECDYLDFRHDWHQLVSQRWGITVEEPDIHTVFTSVSRTCEFDAELSTDSENSQ